MNAKLTQEQLAEVLRLHKLYRDGDPDGRRANLRGADICEANLRGANLYRADLCGAKIPAVAAASTEILPREGEVVGWKKCRAGVLVKLRVPAGAKRSNATGRKCRAERAEVLEVKGGAFGVSLYDGDTEYRVGKSVVADGWGVDRWVECAPGIHFFLTEEEAAAYEG